MSARPIGVDRSPPAATLAIDQRYTCPPVTVSSRHRLCDVVVTSSPVGRVGQSDGSFLLLFPLVNPQREMLGVPMAPVQQRWPRPGAIPALDSP